MLSAEELAAAAGPRTRVPAVTWVDSFTGRALDLHALGTACRQAGVLLVVNASQAVGALAAPDAVPDQDRTWHPVRSS